LWIWPLLNTTSKMEFFSTYVLIPLKLGNRGPGLHDALEVDIVPLLDAVRVQVGAVLHWNHRNVWKKTIGTYYKLLWLILMIHLKLFSCHVCITHSTTSFFTEVGPHWLDLKKCANHLEMLSFRTHCLLIFKLVVIVFQRFYR
jgi:hypothetical protein